MLIRIMYLFYYEIFIFYVNNCTILSVLSMHFKDNYQSSNNNVLLLIFHWSVFSSFPALKAIGRGNFPKTVNALLTIDETY